MADRLRTKQRGRYAFSIRDLLVDTLIIAIGVGLSSYAPGDPFPRIEFVAIVFVLMLMAVITGRVGSRKLVARLGAAAGGVLGLALGIPPIFVTETPEYRSVVLLPGFSLSGAILTYLFFLGVYRLQHFGEKKRFREP